MKMEFIEILKVILLGVVQGITEWLPISSTGHLILINELFPLEIYTDSVMNTEFVDMFMVVIQLGSILAVAVLYFKKLNPFKKDKKESLKTINLWMKVAVAAVPAGIIGLLFDDIIDQYLYNWFTVAITLIIYGIAFIWIESKKPKNNIKTIQDLTYKTAFMIGVFQVLALIPGTSRSGSTILGAVILGLSRPLAAEFSFFLAIPMMFAASFLKLIKLSISLTMFGWVALLLGTIVAFVVSIIAIKTFMTYIRKHDFKVFGYYRIILGIIVILYFGVL
ncbi:MAG: undecaprenyl-diphosphate phosphatase [Erysipelotrichaceae bacterium]